MKRALNMRRLITTILLFTLSLALVCGAVYAYMFMRTQEKSAVFAPAAVSCSVSENLFDGAYKSGITVTNTGNINAYLRVRLVTYWVNSEGEVAAKSSPTLSIMPAGGWIRASDNTFYYVDPVAPGKSTPALFSGSITLEMEGDFLQVIDVFAEAVQADPVRAAEESWHVTITDGRITAAP